MADTLEAILKQYADDAALEAAKKKQAQLGAQAVPQDDSLQGPASPFLAAFQGAQQPSVLKSVEQDKTPSAIDPREWAKANAIAENQPELRALKEKILQNEQLLQNPAMLGNTQIDLSPLLGWASSMSDKPGGNAALLQAYQGMRPQQPQDVAKTIMGIQNLIEKNRTGLSEEQLKYIKEALSGSKTKAFTEQEGSTKAAGGGGDPTVKYKRYVDQFNKDDTIKPLRMGISTASNILQDLSNPNAISDTAVVRNIAKMHNTGALTDKDVEAFSSSGSMALRLKNGIEKAESGQMDEDVRKLFIEFANNMIQGKARDLADRAKIFSSEVGGKIYGYDPQTAYQALSPSLWEPILKKKEAEQAGKEQFMQTFNSIGQELERRKAGK